MTTKNVQEKHHVYRVKHYQTLTNATRIIAIVKQFFQASSTRDLWICRLKKHWKINLGLVSQSRKYKIYSDDNGSVWSCPWFQNIADNIIFYLTVGFIYNVVDNVCKCVIANILKVQTL